MPMNKKLVTSYQNPDLDGTACAIGYAELLKQQDEDVIAAVFGAPHREAQFVMQTFNIPQPKNAEELIEEYNNVILVDASDTEGISSKINPQQVVEIIDHRKINEADKFPNAKVQIELVGSAATLITEKFYAEDAHITESSAALLYSAIISNTINFQANVTTERDKKMAEWLQTKFQIPSNYIHNMFADKSTFTVPLKEVFEHDFATFTFNDKHLGIMQLEIVSVQEFIGKNLQEIKTVLGEMKNERNLDYIFLTAIDLEKATNTFVVIDMETQNLVEKSLHVTFQNGMAFREGIMMRKTITPFIKEAIENGSR